MVRNGESENRDRETGESEFRRETIDASIWLDRLVDGEIGDDEQRQLLLALESQPDGWRRCALTFLEAQTLRKDLAGVGNNLEVMADSGARAPLRVAAKRGRSNLASQRVRWFAMAACFVLAFVIGTLARGWLTSNSLRDSRGPSSQDVQVATNVGHQEPTTASGQGDGKSEPGVEVPMVDASNVSKADVETMLADKKPLLSEAELKAFENNGHLVGQRRALYPVQLGDGRVAVVPVDLVEVRDTGGWQ